MRRHVLMTPRFTLLRVTRTNMAVGAVADADAEAAAAAAANVRVVVCISKLEIIVIQIRRHFGSTEAQIRSLLAPAKVHIKGIVFSSSPNFEFTSKNRLPSTYRHDFIVYADSVYSIFINNRVFISASWILSTAISDIYFFTIRINFARIINIKI